MCDVCRSTGEDYTFKNGEKSKYMAVRVLYRIVPRKKIRIKLCFVHDVDLFCMGESRFALTYTDALNAKVGSRDSTPSDDVMFESTTRVNF